MAITEKILQCWDRSSVDVFATIRTGLCSFQKPLVNSLSSTPNHIGSLYFYRSGYPIAGEYRTTCKRRFRVSLEGGVHNPNTHEASCLICCQIKIRQPILLSSKDVKRCGVHLPFEPPRQRNLKNRIGRFCHESLAAMLSAITKTQDRHIFSQNVGSALQARLNLFLVP